MTVAAAGPAAVVLRNDANTPAAHTTKDTIAEIECTGGEHEQVGSSTCTPKSVAMAHPSPSSCSLWATCSKDSACLLEQRAVAEPPPCHCRMRRQQSAITVSMDFSTSLADSLSKAFLKEAALRRALLDSQHLYVAWKPNMTHHENNMCVVPLSKLTGHQCCQASRRHHCTTKPRCPLHQGLPSAAGAGAGPSAHPTARLECCASDQPRHCSRYRCAKSVAQTTADGGLPVATLSCRKCAAHRPIASHGSAQHAGAYARDVGAQSCQQHKVSLA